MNELMDVREQKALNIQRVGFVVMLTVHSPNVLVSDTPNSPPA
jgi:hypothetical protein